MNTGNILTLIIIAVASYLIGNINPSILIGKIRGIDIRKEGSGNAGMTNAIRVMGLGAGIAVLVIDVMKAFVSVKAGYAFGAEAGAVTAFAAVVLGHCFPVFFGFKGGKGVAASLGAAFALNWPSALGAVAVAAVLFAVSRRMSLSSIGAAVAYPALILFLAPEYLTFSLFAATFLVIMHRENIIRLINGEEQALTIGGKKKTGDDAGDSGKEVQEDPKEL